MIKTNCHSNQTRHVVKGVAFKTNNMRPFNYDEFKSNPKIPIVTRCGWFAEIDEKWALEYTTMQVFLYDKNNKKSYCAFYDRTGKWGDRDSHLDLMIND